MEYRVQLDVFSGPLDLLLYLVKRHELEILDLPIATITRQFVELIETLEILDLDLIGDFVVMASTLVEIKSRMVLPRPEELEPEVQEGDDDPRSDLVRQLIEYKKYKDAARLLEHQAAAWQEHYPRLSDEHPVDGGDPSEDRIKEVELWDLVSALSRILRRSPATNQTSIVYDDTPISTYVQRILALVMEQGKVAFSSLFEGVYSKSKVVGIFLAILELLRHYHLRAEQPVEYGEIWVLPPRETVDTVLVPSGPTLFVPEAPAQPLNPAPESDTPPGQQ
jgi:segregation and condensation protein A